MKKRMFALLLALSLLSGCAAVTSRDYLSVRPHVGSLASKEDPSVFRAETYTKLVEDIHSMVEAGLSHGVVHLANYRARNPAGDMETDLADACAEVAGRDPLGAYAVDFIKHDKSYIVSYYEANIYISYRRTQEQVKNIVAVTGSNAIRGELQEALSKFSTEKVLRISYFNESEESIQNLIRQAYYGAPQFALGMPEIKTEIYPAAEQSYHDPLRIVEILLTYPEEQKTLRRQALELATKAEAVTATFTSVGDAETAQEIYRLLRRDVELTAGGGMPGAKRRDTAYAALVGGTADSEGLALAFQMLCDRTGLESTVVSGGSNGVPHFWNIVALSDGEYRHVDVTRESGFGLSDADLVTLGYAWDREEYRACGAQPPKEEPAVTPSHTNENTPLTN